MADADLGGLPAHHPGEADRPGVVGDEQVVRVEGPVDVVEGAQPLAGPGPAHDDRAGQPVGVVGVQRLAELEHHVVGDVDGQRDRAHAAGSGPAAPATCGLGAVGSKPLTRRATNTSHPLGSSTATG